MISPTITKRMDTFLETVKTPAKTYVGVDGLSDEQLQYITQVKEATLPMRIRLWQPNETGVELGIPRIGNMLELQLLVNPESMNHGKTNSTQIAYTRKGFVTQLWGPNQDTISLTGKSAAFFVPGEGLSTFNRRSLGFHNIMALLAAYRNNGYQFMDPLRSGSDNRHLNRVVDVVRGVELSYDGDAYQGHFSTFTLDQDAASPYLLSFNCEFVVSALTGFDSDAPEIRGHFVPAKYTQRSRGELDSKPEKFTLPTNTPLNYSVSPQAEVDSQTNADTQANKAKK